MHPENNIKDHSNNCDLVIVIVTIMLYTHLRDNPFLGLKNLNGKFIM